MLTKARNVKSVFFTPAVQILLGESSPPTLLKECTLFWKVSLESWLGSCQPTPKPCNTHVHRQTQKHTSPFAQISDYNSALFTALIFRRARCGPWEQQWWMWWCWTLKGSQKWRGEGAGVLSPGSSWRTTAGRGSLPGHPLPVVPCSEPGSLTGQCSPGKERTTWEQEKMGDGDDE